jgi:hypothetical protein
MRESIINSHLMLIIITRSTINIGTAIKYNNNNYKQ